MNRYIKLIGLLLVFIFPICVFGKESEGFLESLNIKGYDINFNKDIFEYSLSIDEEDFLDISYTLSDENLYVSIDGNGNFNSDKNIITIDVNHENQYKIYVYKTVKTALVNTSDKPYQMNKNEKDVLALSLICTSSMVVVYVGYMIFFKIKEAF